jgi:hypothetical protein
MITNASRDEAAHEALKELKEMFPGEFCRIRTDVEFWPEGVLSKPEETATTVLIQIGFLRNVRKFDGATLNEAMNQVRNYNPYEDQLCAECNYSIDNTGLCVLDATHNALPQQT